MSRAAQIIQKAALGAHEAIVLSKRSNIFYVSGYTGEGIALIADGLSAVVTDSRYTEQVTRQAPGFQVYEIKTGQSHEKLAAEILKEHGLNAVRFEADEVTVARYTRMQDDMPGFSFAPLHGEPELTRRIKDAAEIECMRKACDISCRALDNILPRIKPGVTETDIRIDLEFEMLRLGAQGLAFDTIVASGANGSLPHAIPSGKKIEAGDMITMDFGARFGGYCADMTRTVAVGEPNAEMKKIYGIVYEAQCAAQDALRAGVPANSIDKIARDIIANAGYGACFGHGLGHSVGIDIHENPRLSPLCADILEVNTTMTVEPGIYVPGLGGVRIENTCVIGAEGSETLVYAPKELLIL